MASDQASGDDIAGVVTAAIKKLDAANSLDDIEKIVGIAKAGAETEQARAGLQQQEQKHKLELRQSLASLLVPAISLLALVLTIGIQAYQLYVQSKSQAEQALDQQWLDFLKSSSAYARAQYTDPSYVPRLQYFINSAPYHDAAMGIALNVMGSVANAPGFAILLSSTIPSVDETNLKQAIYVLKLLRATDFKLANQCAELTIQVDPEHTMKPNWLGLCSSSFSDRDLQERFGSKSPWESISRMRPELADVDTELNMLSEEVAVYLRTRYGTARSISDKSAPTVDFRGVYLFRADLSNVDFSNFDLSDAQFDEAKLDGAKITPVIAPIGFDLGDSEWWNASEISERILEDLLANPRDTYGGTVLTSSVSPVKYRDAVRRLCRRYGSFVAWCDYKLEQQGWRRPASKS